LNLTWGPLNPGAAQVVLVFMLVPLLVGPARYECTL